MGYLLCFQPFPGLPAGGNTTEFVLKDVAGEG
jgi:hypothetical protein